MQNGEIAAHISVASECGNTYIQLYREAGASWE